LLSDLAYSPNGKEIAVGYTNGVVHRFAIEVDDAHVLIDDRPQVISAHDGKVFCTRYINADRLVTCGNDGLVRIWNIAAGMIDNSDVAKQQWTGPTRLRWNKPPPQEAPLALELSPDGSLLLYHGQEILVYDTDRGELLSRQKKGAATAWSPFGNNFALARARSFYTDVWDRNGNALCTMSHAFTVSAIAFSPTGDLIATLGGNQLETNRADNGADILSQTLPGSGLSVAFSPDGKKLACGGLYAGVLVFDVLKLNLVHHLPDGFDTHDLAYSPDGTLLAAAQNDGMIRVWETQTGLLRAKFADDGGVIKHVEFSPDGRILFSRGGHNDRFTRLWWIGGQQNFITLQDVMHSKYCASSFSADGRHFAIVYDRGPKPEVLLWHKSPY
jgi:WD40 repeat protein